MQIAFFYILYLVANDIFIVIGTEGIFFVFGVDEGKDIGELLVGHGENIFIIDHPEQLFVTAKGLFFQSKLLPLSRGNDQLYP
jgi:hypothetical protein